MKLMDEKGRLFGKINVFDLLVLVVVIIGVFGMTIRKIEPWREVLQMETATYHLKITGAQECHLNGYKVGDDLYEGNTYLGKITEVKENPSKVLKLLTDGTAKMVERALYYDIELTFTTDQFNDRNGYHIDTAEWLSGTAHVISNGFVVTTAVVESVEIPGENAQS